MSFDIHIDISGAPGIGKTHLMARVVRALLRDGLCYSTTVVVDNVDHAQFIKEVYDDSLLPESVNKCKIVVTETVKHEIAPIKAGPFKIVTTLYPQGPAPSSMSPSCMGYPPVKNG